VGIGYADGVPRNLSNQLQAIVKGELVTQIGSITMDQLMLNVNNVPHVGHQHPRVVAAAQKQLAVLNTNTRYLHDKLLAYAESLAATLPDPLSVCYFVNSGSEANELAIRMAKAYTGRKDLLVLEVGYHGNTNACVDASSYKFDGPGGKGLADYIHKLPIPDPYRGAHKYGEGDAGPKYAAAAIPILQDLASNERPVSAFLGESILSCGGQIVPPLGYLSTLYRHVREAGGICIADEVQTGLGRVGEQFWAFELQGVVPDIVTLGKPIGNGHPLGAVVTTRAVADAFHNGMEYFNTFGGNPVSCSIGLEVLQIVQEEGLQAKALELGQYLKKGLMELQDHYPIIGDVRGHGLFLGFELVKDGATLEPAAEQCRYLANRMRRLGILMSTDGPYHNVIKIKPPMCFEKKHANHVLAYLAQVLEEDGMKI
ncbi:MAG: aminotransferase class III-fold pyridoxal phosphate-dependent enzyme, partial [Bacteroidota bacterium]